MKGPPKPMRTIMMPGTTCKTSEGRKVTIMSVHLFRYHEEYEVGYWLNAEWKTARIPSFEIVSMDDGGETERIGFKAEAVRPG